jgi:hypothetical protein
MKDVAGIALAASMIRRTLRQARASKLIRPEVVQIAAGGRRTNTELTSPRYLPPTKVLLLQAKGQSAQDDCHRERQRGHWPWGRWYCVLVLLVLGK